MSRKISTGIPLDPAERSSMDFYDQLEQIRQCCMQKNAVVERQLSEVQAEDKQLLTARTAEDLELRDDGFGAGAQQRLAQFQREFEQATSAYLARVAAMREAIKAYSKTYAGDSQALAAFQAQHKALEEVQRFLHDLDLQSNLAQGQPGDLAGESVISAPGLQRADPVPGYQNTRSLKQADIGDVVSQPYAQFQGTVRRFPAVCPLSALDDASGYRTDVFVPRLMFGKSCSEIRADLLSKALSAASQRAQLSQLELNVAWLIVCWLCYKKAGVLVASARDAYFDKILLTLQSKDAKVALVQISLLDERKKRSLADVGVVPLVFRFGSPVLPSFDVLSRSLQTTTVAIATAHVHVFVAVILDAVRRVVASKIGV